MATTLFSVRLSLWLDGALNQLTKWIGRSPSRLVEDLLESSEIEPSKITQVEDEESLTEKINLRLSPEAMERLRQLARGAGIEPSVFIRLMLIYLIEDYEVFDSVYPDVVDEEEWESLFEEEENEDEEVFDRRDGIGAGFLGAVVALGLVSLFMWFRGKSPERSG